MVQEPTGKEKAADTAMQLSLDYTHRNSSPQRHTPRSSRRATESPFYRKQLRDRVCGLNLVSWV